MKNILLTCSAALVFGCMACNGNPFAPLTDTCGSSAPSVNPSGTWTFSGHGTREDCKDSKFEQSFNLTSSPVQITAVDKTGDGKPETLTVTSSEPLGQTRSPSGQSERSHSKARSRQNASEASSG